MGCLPVRGDNPRALASGLSYVQVDKHGITILYLCTGGQTWYNYFIPPTSAPCTLIFRAKVGKGGIKGINSLRTSVVC